MKNLFLALAILLYSIAAFAKVDHYRCELENKTDRPAVLDLHSKNITKRGILKVNFTHCELTKTKNFDICRFEGNSLIINIDPSTSVLMTKKGKSIEYFCEESDPDWEGEEDDQDESEGEGQQQQEQQSEPGHGGSNIRGRGIQ